VGTTLLRGAFAYLISGGLLFAAVVIGSMQPQFSRWVAPVESFYPITVMVVAVLLGWRFDRSRMVFATVILAASSLLLEYYGAQPNALGHAITNAVHFLLPINIALLALLKERGTFTLHGLLRWILLFLQPLAIAALWGFQKSTWLGYLESPLIQHSLLDNIAIKQPALLTFTLALLITGYKSVGRHNVMEKGLFWALALLAYGLLSEQLRALTPVLFATALLVLVIAVLEISYTMAFRDDLTGLPGRRALNQALLKLGKRYTIAMLDVDHFKKFNDRYGHDVGDQALQMVASKLGNVTGGGKPYRYGGEEFSVLFPGKHLEEALPHLEQLRAAIAGSGFRVRNWKRPRKKPGTRRKTTTHSVQITISIGAAEREGDSKKPHAVIKAADKALYKAKKGGRNRVAS
jgi:diguanylate cyclase (GGDEF)-like protein